MPKTGFKTCYSWIILFRESVVKLICLQVFRLCENIRISFYLKEKSKFFFKKKIGEAGYRSLCLSHAKRAFYHLNYFPGQEREAVFSTFPIIFCDNGGEDDKHDDEHDDDDDDDDDPYFRSKTARGLTKEGRGCSLPIATEPFP